MIHPDTLPLHREAMDPALADRARRHGIHVPALELGEGALRLINGIYNSYAQVGGFYELTLDTAVSPTLQVVLDENQLALGAMRVGLKHDLSMQMRTLQVVRGGIVARGRGGPKIDFFDQYKNALISLDNDPSYGTRTMNTYNTGVWLAALVSEEAQSKTDGVIDPNGPRLKLSKLQKQKIEWARDVAGDFPVLGYRALSGNA